MGFLRVYYRTLSLSSRAFLHCRDSLLNRYGKRAQVFLQQDNQAHTPGNQPPCVAFPFEALVCLLCLAVLRHRMQGEQRAPPWFPRWMEPSLIAPCLSDILGQRMVDTYRL